MAYDTKTVKRDGSGITPVPQHFNPIADDYEPIYGRNNAGRVELYGPDGNPISADDSNKLAVRATEIESLLNDIKGKDFATQTTVAAILNKIISAPATEAKQTALAALIGEVQASPTANTLLARLKSLEDKIAAIDSVLDAIVDGSAPAVTQLSGSNIEVADDAAIGTTKVVPTGGKFNAAPATRAEGDAVMQQMTATGAAHVAVVGSILGKDPATGNPVELTAEQDPLGNWVLRTVKAAEVAYDEDLDVFKAKDIGMLTGEILYYHTMTGSSYIGSTVVNNVASVVPVDLQNYKNICIIIKNNDTTNTASINQVVLTTYETAGASDFTAGKVKCLWNLTGIEIAPGAVYGCVLDDLLELGTPHNATTTALGDFVKQFKRGLAFSFAYSRTDDGTCDVIFLGSK